MRRSALVDHATLTAVQRLLGDIRVKNLYNIDGDVVAFEGLLQALLFYDDIACIDDYKPEYRDARQRRFAFINFIPTTEIGYKELMAAAREKTADVLLRIRGNAIVDSDFASFFDMLRCHLVFNWVQNTSVFYLTVNLLANSKGLAVEKYGALNAMLTTQRWMDGGGHKDVSDSLAVSDSNGKQLPDNFTRDERFAIGADIKEFAAALNWLSLKTAFYCFVADATGMDVVLHPIRHAFLVNQIRRLYEVPTSVCQTLLEIVRSGIKGTVYQIRGASDPLITEFKMPLFCAYLATRVQDPRDFINGALHMREEGLFVEARHQLEELEALHTSGEHSKYVTEINKLQRSLKETAGRLLAKYAVTTAQTLPATGFANAVLKAKSALTIPDAIKVRTPRPLIGITDRYGFRGLFRSVVQDLTAVERLGRLHDTITSAVRRDKDASEKRPREERPQWVGKSNSIKRYL